MLPSGPGAMNQGARSGVRPVEYSVTSPCLVIRPMRPGLAASVNQSAPSVPVVMPVGREFFVSFLSNWVISPSGVMRPIAPGSPFSVNQTLPSGPAVMSVGVMSGVMPMLFSVITPAGVMRPMRPGLADSVNQRLPSSPAVMAVGSLFGVRPALNSVIVAVGRDAADEGGRAADEPQVAVGALGDVPGVARSEAGRELGEGAVGRDAADRAVEARLGDPDVAVGTLRDALRRAGERHGAVPLADQAVAGADRAEGTRAVEREPEPVAGALGDAPGAVVRAQPAGELGDGGLMGDRGRGAGGQDEGAEAGCDPCSHTTVVGPASPRLHWTFVRLTGKRRYH